MTTLLIDGDVFVFRCAYNAQEQVDWGNGLISSWVNTFQAQAHLKRTLNTLKEKLNADDMIIALSSPISFRKTLYQFQKLLMHLEVWRFSPGSSSRALARGRGDPGL